MGTFALSGMAEPDEEATEFSLGDLLDILAELQVEIECTEEGEQILEALDPPPAWDVTEVGSILAGFVLRLETAPGHIDKGTTVYFEDESRAYAVDNEAAFEALTQDMISRMPELQTEDQRGGFESELRTKVSGLL